MSELTWTCHVCGDERPDAAISVYSSDYRFPSGITMTQNVRYCNDRPGCVAGARNVKFLPDETEAREVEK